MGKDTQRGFTLIELMVVLVIVGIMTAAISLSIKPRPAQQLRDDALGLVQLLQIAQAEARADGRPILWRADAKGFSFSRTDFARSGIDGFGDDPQLRPRRWRSRSVKVRVMPRQAVVMTAEWIGTPLQIELSDGQHRLLILRSATGQLQVVQDS